MDAAHAHEESSVSIEPVQDWYEQVSSSLALLTLESEKFTRLTCTIFTNFSHFNRTLKIKQYRTVFAGVIEAEMRVCFPMVG